MVIITTKTLQSFLMHEIFSHPGAVNGVMEVAANGGEKPQNRDRGGGGGRRGVIGAEGGGDLSSINAMMSTVMSAAGTINGAGEGEGESAVTSASSSAGPSPR